MSDEVTAAWRTLAERLPDFDFSNMMMIDPECAVYPEMLIAFHDEFAPMGGQIGELIDAGRLPEAQRLLHKMKGVAGTMGAVGLHRTCQSLDAELKQARFEPATLAAWRAMHHDSMGAIDKVLRRGGAADASGAFDADALAATLAEMAAALRRHEFVPDALLLRVRHSLPAGDVPYERLARHVHDIDYPAALAVVAEIARAAQLTLTEPASRPDSRDTLLIVDDASANVYALALLLHNDYRVKVAVDGPTALRIAVASPVPDLVLLDVVMPGMDGYQVLGTLKADARTRDIPVIFVSAATDEISESRGLTLGAVDYISKPVVPAVAALRIRNQLALLRYQRRLVERDAHLRAIEETTSDGLIHTDAEGRILEVNAAYEELSGYPRAELIGKPIQSLEIDAVDPALPSIRMDRIRSAGAALIELQHRRKDGGSWYVEANVAYEATGTERAFFFLRDISERKLAERRNRLQTELLKMLADGAALPDILGRITERLQSPHPDLRAAIFLFDEVTGRLQTGAAPGLPEAVCRAVCESGTVPPGLPVCGMRSLLDSEQRPLGLLLLCSVGEPVPAEQFESQLAHAAEFAVMVVERGRVIENTNLSASVYSGTSEAMLITDAARRIISVNPAFTRLFGYTLDELQAGAMEEQYRAVFSAERQREVDAALAVDGKWQLELSLTRRDGSAFPALVTLSGVRNRTGVMTHQLAMFFDLSRIKEAEEAVAANAAKSEFLANMSHELRTPMNGVIGMVDILENSQLDRRQRRSINTIRESSLALLRILNDILDFSKIEAGKLEVESVPFSLREAMETVADMLAGSAVAKDLELNLFIDPALPRRVVGDAVRLRQILFNIAGNAIKFTQTTAERRGRVDVRAERQADGTLRITIRDNGIGISEKALQKLFSPFSQADASTTRRFGGTGLGLSISRRLAELLGGTIGVQSVEGVGSTFTVELPLEVAPPGVAEAVVDLGGVTLLAIDDGAFHVEVLSSYLGDAGARVRVVPEAELASVTDVDRIDAIVLPVSHVDPSGMLPPRLQQLPRIRLIYGGSIPGVHESLNGIVVVAVTPLRYADLLQSVALACGRLSARDIVEASDQRKNRRREPPTVEQAERDGALVLLAEDNETNRDVIQEQLRLLGYACETAVDGVDALQRWRSGRHAVLLTDCHMPAMDGFQLTAAIRAAGERGEHFPIIAVTANAMQGEATRCLAAGMDDYLAKPVRLNELGRVMNRWLPHGRAGGNATANPEDAMVADAESPPAPEPSPAPAPEPTPQVWDATALTRLIGDNPVMHQRMLRKYMDNSDQIIGEIVDAVAAGNARVAGDLAHKLKSGARSVGCLALGELCEALEHAGRGGDLPRTRALAIDVQQAYDMACALLRAHAD